MYWMRSSSSRASVFQLYLNCIWTILNQPGIRVYIFLSIRHKNKVRGLCGNFNDNEDDDFHDLQSGLIVNTPMEFGNIWKAVPSCPDLAGDQDYDPCLVWFVGCVSFFPIFNAKSHKCRLWFLTIFFLQINPERNPWALDQCRIIISGDAFKECREKVPNYHAYYKDCMYDSCG